MGKYYSIIKYCFKIGLIFSALSIFSGAIHEENIHDIPFKYYAFVYKETTGSLSNTFAAQIETIKNELFSNNLRSHQIGILFTNYDTYTPMRKEIGRVPTPLTAAELKRKTPPRTYLGNYPESFYKTPDIVHIGMLIVNFDRASLPVGYNYIEVNNSHKGFQINNNLYITALVNQNDPNHSPEIAANMRVRDRIHMLNYMKNFERDYEGMFEIYDIELNTYTFLALESVNKAQELL